VVLENEKCRVEIKEDKSYKVGSANNRHYDITLSPSGYERCEFYRTLSIDIDLFSEKLQIALIGSPYIGHSDIAVLEDEILTVLIDDTIVQLQVTDGIVVRVIDIDDFGTNFSIYKVEKGYVIHGEMTITMLDFDFQEKWSVGGADIFVTSSGEDSFEIQDDIICVHDFLGNYYEIDFEGKQVKFIGVGDTYG
jgi:hypothetical protein